MEDEKLTDILLSLSEKCFSAAERTRKGLGLAASEYRGLSCLISGEKISCQDFSSRMKLSISRSSRIVERLYKKGLLERTECRSDRRCKHIWLTEKGIQVRMKVRAVRMPIPGT